MYRYILNRRIHTAYSLTVFSISLVAGVWLMSILPINQFGNTIWIISGLATLVAGLIVRPVIMSIPLVILAGVTIGLWRAAPYASDFESVRALYGRVVTISGFLSEDPRIESTNKYSFRLDNVEVNGTQMRGSLWLGGVSVDDKVARGDKVYIEGTISPGFGNYVASVSAADVVEIAQYSKDDFGLWVREGFNYQLRRVVADPAASLGLGFLVGQQSNLPGDLSESLKIAGLTHIVVASGYNLTILVRFSRRIFEKLSKYLAAVSSVGVIFAFISITGWSPSMTRAGMVALISLAAWYYGRKINPIVLLGIVAGLTVMINPTNAWGDLGWQLSFASFSGILILAPLLGSYFFGDKKENPIVRIILETSSAYVMTLPIIVTLSGSISTVAIVANLLVLPVVPFAMAMTFASGVSVIMNVWVGQIIGWLTQFILMYVFWIATYLSSLNFALLSLSFNTFWSIVWYLVIAGVIIYLKKITGFRLGQVNVVQ